MEGGSSVVLKLSLDPKRGLIAGKQSLDLAVGVVFTGQRIAKLYPTATPSTRTGYLQTQQNALVANRSAAWPWTTPVGFLCLDEATTTGCRKRASSGGRSSTPPLRCSVPATARPKTHGGEECS